jgi:LacI family transcriptional regulator
MKDIARELNVSVVTVSKALANKDGVSEATRSRVKDTARALGYTPPNGPRRNGAAVPRKIGVLIYQHFIHDPSGEIQQDSFYWHIYSLLSLRLSELNGSNVLEIITPEMEKNGIVSAAVQGKTLDGLIVLGQVSGSYLDRLADLPLVLLDFYTQLDRYPYVAANDFHNSYLITSYLIGQGHRDVGFVGSIWGDATTTSILDRYWGMRKALWENGLPLREDWVLPDRVDRTDMRPVVFPSAMPTALVCNCDRSARFTVEALQEAGYRVPDDVSVVGFDDSVFSRVARPHITTIALDVEAMAARAVESVMSAIEKPDVERESFVIQGKLLVRDSVKRLERL